ncbi:alpha/beta fold hydrolase [Ciceribacter sp. L1K22]|uniref:alpha/beta fold hydrolase n=1 Tax=Ciceribacter sp. L1K22 TaxID=2820275 RepID=UPI001ABE9FD7|nr:alpha/beta fold hydrolase [Ciceribacter sp. L1K22]MBO3758967.1 alpha/beta hydrolase [Ciceribacter sp. L1K22]
MQANGSGSDGANGSTAGEIDPDVDLDIISNTYRAIIDQEAFDAMIASWQTKLRRIPDDENGSRRLSPALLAQLALARNTLESLDLPTENDPLVRAVQEVPGPALVLSPEGRVAVTNTEAASALGARQGSFLDADRIDPRSLETYRTLMRAANKRANRSQAILRLMPLQGDHTILAEAWLLSRDGHNADFVVIRSLEIEWTERASDMLGQAFGLSVAEIDIARLFFKVRDVAEIAAKRGVSLLTVRTQLKSIMAKTEAPSQVDLMRLLAMTAGRAIQDRQGKTDSWRDPLGREEILTLPGGRAIAWTWLGHPDGRPVILCRGLPMCYLLPPDIEDQLTEAGVKLLALSRPGFGNSSQHAELSPLEDNLAALRGFLDKVVGEPCVGIGLSNGLVPLLAEAQTHPDRFRSLIAIGYTGVLDRSGIRRLQPTQQAMMRLAGMMPWLVDLMAKQAHRMIQTYGVDWYIERAYRTRPRDYSTCADANLTPFIRNACAHLLAQGHSTFVRELILARSDIDDAVEALKIPLTWLAPTEDGVFDEAGFRQIENRNKRIRMQPLRDAGELALYQQTSRIVDLIIREAHGMPAER